MLLLMKRSTLSCSLSAFSTRLKASVSFQRRIRQMMLWMAVKFFCPALLPFRGFFVAHHLMCLSKDSFGQERAFWGWARWHNSKQIFCQLKDADIIFYLTRHRFIYFEWFGQVQICKVEHFSEEKNQNKYINVLVKESISLQLFHHGDIQTWRLTSSCPNTFFWYSTPSRLLKLSIVHLPLFGSHGFLQIFHKIGKK